jgi:hypothetical protein
MAERKRLPRFEAIFSFWLITTIAHLLAQAPSQAGVFQEIGLPIVSNWLGWHGGRSSFRSTVLRQPLARKIMVLLGQFSTHHWLPSLEAGLDGERSKQSQPSRAHGRIELEHHSNLFWNRSEDLECRIVRAIAGTTCTPRRAENTTRHKSLVKHLRASAGGNCSSSLSTEVRRHA